MNKFRGISHLNTQNAPSPPHLTTANTNNAGGYGITQPPLFHFAVQEKDDMDIEDPCSSPPSAPSPLTKRYPSLNQDEITVADEPPTLPIPFGKRRKQENHDDVESASIITLVPDSKSDRVFDIIEEAECGSSSNMAEVHLDAYSLDNIFEDDFSDDFSDVFLNDESSNPKSEPAVVSTQVPASQTPQTPPQTTNSRTSHTPFASIFLLKQPRTFHSSPPSTTSPSQWIKSIRLPEATKEASRENKEITGNEWSPHRKKTQYLSGGYAEQMIGFISAERSEHAIWAHRMRAQSQGVTSPNSSVVVSIIAKRSEFDLVSCLCLQENSNAPSTNGECEDILHVVFATDFVSTNSKKQELEKLEIGRRVRIFRPWVELPLKGREDAQKNGTVKIITSFCVLDET
ncbi:uncharacterized protein VTP21DRAFT_11203 [Calcarisporiella thermophila]|uniref:uncharacterized protein n=1 Tax=Calcarisporiella thermophila TaxID=911321 RepID=UPI00374281CA